MVVPQVGTKRGRSSATPHTHTQAQQPHTPVAHTHPTAHTQPHPHPHTAGLLDSFGRVATDLRLSVTDRCNLRCDYCLPEENQQWIHRDNLLSVADYRRLIPIALDLGITDIRITGGEPLLRPDLANIIAVIAEAFASRDMEPRIALTTNAIGLEKQIDTLVNAGLRRINISLDTLDRDRYRTLTHRDRLPDALAGLEATRTSTLSPVKVNTVIVDRAALQEIPALIDYCLRRNFQWRAIEYMPIGPLSRSTDKRPTLDDILQTISSHYDITPRPTRPGAPARRWNVTREDGTHLGVVGVIASESAPFCRDCERTRLSADGRIYSCLFDIGYTDVMKALRGGATDGQIAQLWRDAMWHKPSGHQALSALPLNRTMSQIGG